MNNRIFKEMVKSEFEIMFGGDKKKCVDHQSHDDEADQDHEHE